jgi:predicted NAD-dependent protein-ADP-ribosyltransferase YbiA (DUF1768 family)
LIVKRFGSAFANTSEKLRAKSFPSDRNMTSDQQKNDATDIDLAKRIRKVSWPTKHCRRMGITSRCGGQRYRNFEWCS